MKLCKIIFAFLLLPAILGPIGCANQSVSAQAATVGSRNGAKMTKLKQSALALPVLAKLVIASKGVKTEEKLTSPERCQSLNDELNKLQTLNDKDGKELFKILGKKVMNDSDQSQEIHIAKKAFTIIKNKQYEKDVVSFVSLAGIDIAEYPLDVQTNLRRLTGNGNGNTAKVLQADVDSLLEAIRDDYIGAEECGIELDQYVKKAIPSLPSQKCKHKMGNHFLLKLRKIPEADLLAATAKAAADNPTIGAAIQIYAYAQWHQTISDDNLKALSAALSNDPDLTPLINSGIDTMAQSYGLDKLIDIVEKINHECNSVN